MIYQIAPVSKPRMTQSDRWKKRACVVRYWAFKDKVRELGISVPICGSHIIFTLEMPKSWSAKKKAAMNGKGHRTTPDKDNLEKGLLDAIYDSDCHIWDSRVTKVWGYKPSIEIIN